MEDTTVNSPAGIASLSTRAVFQVKDLVKTYGSRVVLSLKELKVLPREIFGIVGPSGSGKSTLLRILNLLETPDNGRLFFDGVLQEFGARNLHLRRKITMVFQKPLFFQGTVLQNACYGLRVRGVSKEERRRKALWALELVGIEGLAKVEANSISGGEQQRLALARALVIEPEVLLLDEPTTDLDPYNVSVIEDLIRKINADLGTTIVLVTHNVFQARRLAHRLMFLLDGKAIEVGDTHQVFHNPQDPRTRAFLQGDMVC